MHNSNELSDLSPPALRQLLELTKTSLANKIEGLKADLATTYEHAESSVNSSILNAKDALSIRHQIQQHPWTMVNSAIGVGLLLGRTFSASRHPVSPTHSQDTPSSTERPPAQRAGRTIHKNGFGAVLDNFQSELSQVRAASIGALVGTIGHMAKRSAPAFLSGRIGDAFDVVTAHLGGRFAQHGAELSKDSKPPSDHNCPVA